MKVALSAALVSVGIVAGCSQTAPAEPSGAQIVVDDAAITTSAAEYVLQPSGGGLVTEIPITFRNTTHATLYIVNCNQHLEPVLEKLTPSGWEPFWGGVVPQCLSPAIVIAPGASHADTLQIWGALPGGNTEPSFRTAELEGSYRIVLHNIVHNYDASYSAGRFGDPVPVEHRSSNTFRLRR